MVCHSGDNLQGELDITKYLSFDEATRNKVKARLTHPDPAKRMPLKRTPDGFAPGEPLSFDELVTFK